MADKIECDLCQRELVLFEEVYFLRYGKKGKFVIDTKEKKGDLCLDCFRELDKFIQSKKVKNG